MGASDLPAELPSRPRSAFAADPDDTKRGKDGRKLGGATNSRFRTEYWTEERREEQRQKMQQLIADGRVGGQNGFHRRKTKKMQEILAEEAQKKADEIFAKLWKMIEQPKDKRLQLEAIREFAKMEAWAVQNSREDEKQFRGMTNKQLDARLLEMLGEALGLDFSGLLEDVVDGTVEDEEFVEIESYDPMDAELGGDRLREAVEAMESEEDLEDLDPELVAEAAGEMVGEDVSD